MIVIKDTVVYSDCGKFLMREDGQYFTKAAIERGKGTEHNYTEAEYVEPTDAETDRRAAELLLADTGADLLVAILSGATALKPYKARLDALRPVARRQLTAYSPYYRAQHPEEFVTDND